MKKSTEEETLKEMVKDKEARRVFEDVFDKQTIETIHSLAVKGYLDVVEFVVSTGKEANVFRARDRAGNFRAVKVYKITTSNFKHMDKYLAGDIRFKAVKGGKRSIVHAWTKKEYKNLELASRAGVRVPLPLAFKNNVLVMEFIGEEGGASKTLKDKRPEDMEKAYETIVDWIARLMYKAGLVHADLSEYNMLGKNQELVLIDIGQAVRTDHPKAKEFFERDIKNLARWFTKSGVKRPYEQIIEDIKAKKTLYKGK